MRNLTVFFFLQLTYKTIDSVVKGAQKSLLSKSKDIMLKCHSGKHESHPDK